MTARDHHTINPLVTINDIRRALKPLISSDNSLATLDRQIKGWAKGVTRDVRASFNLSVRRD